MRANTGTVSVQCLGGYVAGLTPVVGVACKLPLSLFPQHPPFCPLPFLPLSSPPFPILPSDLSGRCTSPLLRPPHAYALHTPHLSAGVVVRSFFTVCCAGKFECKCASQVCPFDASPSQIPRVGAPVGWSVAGWCYEITITTHHKQGPDRPHIVKGLPALQAQTNTPH